MLTFFGSDRFYPLPTSVSCKKNHLGVIICQSSTIRLKLPSGSSAKMARFLFRMLFAAYSLASVSATSPFITLRVRMADGTVERLQASDTLPLAEALSPVTKGLKDKNVSIVTGSSSSKLDTSKTVQELGLKHGSLLSLVSAKTKTKKELTQKKQPSTSAFRYSPFPDLAKDYKTALRKRLAKRSSGSSYSDIADIQSAMHVVEHQATGPVLRVYMCRVSAERFATKGGSCALLLGNFQRERVKARSSHHLVNSHVGQEFKRDACGVVAGTGTSWLDLFVSRRSAQG